MKIIENLISRYCPDGVEYVDLGEVVVFTDGHAFSSGSFTESGEYQVVKITDIFGGLVNRGKTFINELPEKLKNGQQLSGGEILVAMSGSTGKTGYNTLSNAVVNQRIAILRNQDCIENGYLKHLLVNGTFETYCFKNGTGPQNNISKAQLLRYRIPLPPLPIQQEIVRILDTFTNLTAELTAELTARRKQYEYYRDELLRFKNRKDIQWVPFGDYFEFKNGLNKGKEYFGSGNYIVNFTDVYKNRWLEKSMLKGRVQVEDKEVVAYSAQKGDVFFTRTSETREEIGMVSALVDDIDGCVFSGFVLRARPLSQNWLPKFCAYFFSTSFVRKEIIRYASFTTRALTSGPRLSKIKLPLLPIQEQEKIVDILDNFSSLCNGVEKGLPAEISARQKQYEYYRDQLLTFKRIGG